MRNKQRKGIFMSISVDTVNLRFNVKPDYDQQQLQQLQEDLKKGQNELEKTRRAMDKLAKNGLNAMTREEREEFDRLSKSLTKTAREVHENEAKMKQWTRSADINKLSLQQLGQRAKDLTAVLKNLNPTTDEFREYKEELDAVKERMKELRGAAQQTQSSIISFAKTFNHIGFAIINFLAIKDRIVAWADQYVQSFAKMDDAMTDVMKYTGQTKAEVEDMNEAFKQMTTRTAREELNALAGAAGRLGIQGKENIIGFVDAADKINVALGDDLGEGAIDQIGKLTMVFGEDKTKGLNGAMLATGSAINVLGANSSANTGFITEFTSSMAGMAVNAKISQTDIMGYASALSQAGIEGQTASGVFAQLITKMFTDPAKFAKAAQLDVKQFTDLLKTDANAAILQFLEGLKANGGFDALAPALKSLKMQGTQAIPVISSLINKMDELKKAQADARQAYDEGTSIIEEFNNANSSAAAKLEIAKKRLNDVSVELGQKLMPIVEGSVNATTSLLKVLTPLTSVIMSNLTAVVQITIAIIAYNVAVNAAAISTSRFATSIKGAWVATKEWFTTLRLNPYGLAAAALTLFVTEIINYIGRAREAAKMQGQVNEAMREAKKEAASERTELELLVTTIRSNTASEEDRKKALEELNGKLMEQHLGNLTEERVRTGDLTEILDQYNRKLETRIRLERLQQKQKELINKKIDIEEGGYKDDVSWLDRFNQGLVSFGQVLISGHEQGIVGAWNQAWDQVEESFKQRSLSPVLDGLETIEQKLSDIREEEQRIDIMPEIVVNTNKKKTPTNPNSPVSNTDDSSSNMKNDPYEKDLKQREDAYKVELLQLKQQYTQRALTEAQYHDRQYEAEQKFLVDKLSLQQKYGKSEAEQAETAGKYLDSISQQANQQLTDRKAETNRQLQAIDRQQAEEEVALARQRLIGEITSEDDYNRRKLDSDIRYQKQRLLVLQEGSDEYIAAQKQLLSLQQQQQQQQLASVGAEQEANNKWLHEVDMQGQSLDKMYNLNQQYYDRGLISYQQYQQNLDDITQQHAEQRQQIQQEAIQAFDATLSAMTSLFSAMEQRDTARVSKKYDAQIKAARKAGKDTTKLEEQKEAETEKIRKKYAQKQFRLQILQIVSANAQSIANVWKEWAAVPAVAAAFAAAAAAQGAIQLATAKAQAAAAEGLYSGGYSDDYQEGYTKKGNPRRQAGVIPVHQNEFVANHLAVANPQIRPVLDVIDRHQRLGNIQMLNATRLLEEAYGTGRYRGGYSNNTATVPDGSPSGQNTANDSVLLPILERIERNTASALTIRSLRDEIRHEEQIERNARR